MIVCPECESHIDVDQDVMEEGEIVSCSECGTDYEVVTTEPFELVRVEDEDEEEDEEEDAKKDEENEDGDL
jgi:alpha-aminoadipate/glutamate carrier protein LysW